VQLHHSLSLILPHLYRSLDVNNYVFTYASDGVSLDPIQGWLSLFVVLFSGLRWCFPRLLLADIIAVAVPRWLWVYMG
jgi:hypothetical protein